jgi:deoxyribodipyrimidine photo-lyase
MSLSQNAVLVWFRRDLRLNDNPALAAAVASGRPIVPVYILGDGAETRPIGGASKWWLDKSLRALGADLESRGSKLILRSGGVEQTLQALVAETGAGAVFWNRLYEPGQTARDARLKASFKSQGITAQSFNASLLVEPWKVTTGSGGAFKVFTPFWRAAQPHLELLQSPPAPARLNAPTAWPESDALASWNLHPTRPDWSGGFDIWTPGEAGAQARFDRFLAHGLGNYAEGRDHPAAEAISRLSPHLHFGEIGPRQIWAAVDAAVQEAPALTRDADKFKAELGWREFSHLLLFHEPSLPTANFKSAFDAFPWRDDAAAYLAWTRGQTGYPMVDAGMRELWTTGFMHNRVRMLVASFLVKHLLIDWRKGEPWFWDTLVDADLAANAASWQWVAGSGADAAPYFRIFSPVGQGQKFDADGRYVRKWVPELANLPTPALHAPWTLDPAGLRAAGVTLGVTYPKPIVDHGFARERALTALEATKAEPG